MRRGYDPHYGSREQLRAQSEHGMKVARERDLLKAENEQLKIALDMTIRESFRLYNQLSNYELTICPHCGEKVFQ